MLKYFFTVVVCDEKCLEITDLQGQMLFGEKMFHLVTTTGTGVPCAITCSTGYSPDN